MYTKFVFLFPKIVRISNIIGVYMEWNPKKQDMAILGFDHRNS